jgi:peptide/nickel transport system permease protein
MLNLNAVITTILKRLGLGIATLFVVSAIIFSSISMLPGDFTKLCWARQQPKKR